MRVRSLLLVLVAALAAVATAAPAFAAATETPPMNDPVRIAPRIVGGTTVPAGELAYVASSSSTTATAGRTSAAAR